MKIQDKETFDKANMFGIGQENLIKLTYSVWEQKTPLLRSILSVILI